MIFAVPVGEKRPDIPGYNKKRRPKACVFYCIRRGSQNKACPSLTTTKICPA